MGLLNVPFVHTLTYESFLFQKKTKLQNKSFFYRELIEKKKNLEDEKINLGWTQKIVPCCFKLYCAFSLNLSKLFKCFTFNLKKKLQRNFSFLLDVFLFWSFEAKQKKTKHLVFQCKFSVEMQKRYSLFLHLKKEDNNGGSDSDPPLLSFFYHVPPLLSFFLLNY